MESKQLLNSLQANIIRPNARQHNLCVFLQFEAEATAGHLKDLTVRRLPITTAQKQQEYSDLRKQNRETNNDYVSETISCFFLSHKGLDSLDLDYSFITNDFFSDGMANRVPTTNETPAYEWEQPYQADIHAMFLFASDSERDLRAMHQKLRDALSDLPINELFHELGNRMYNEQGRVIEHFGFVDGITNPPILDEEKKINFELLKGSFLVQENTGAWGSLFVYKKYWQNIDFFDQQIEELSEKLNISKAFAEAQVFGRYKDGMPLLISDDPNATEQFKDQIAQFDQGEMDYSQDKAGLRCPFHAHIRKSNPRKDDMVASYFGDKAFSQEIIRRGITYDYDHLNKGLLFMSYQSSISSQFESILTEWCSNTDFPAAGVGTDPVIGTPPWSERESPQRLWLKSWGEASGVADPAELSFHFKPVVRLEGGEYFYAPSITYLEQMDGEV
ncbi:MAG: hypothetical protein AAF847_17735 [Bacteroidota bacterium]